MRMLLFIGFTVVCALPYVTNTLLQVFFSYKVSQDKT